MLRHRWNALPLLAACCMLIALAAVAVQAADALPGLTDAQTAALRQAAPAADESAFVFARVDLYYMTDVTRLMQMLAHVQTPSQWGGEAYAEAKAKAAKARQDLFYAETALAKALAAENDCKSRQAKVAEALKTARDQRDEAQKKLDAATAKEAGIKKQYDAAAEGTAERERLEAELKTATVATADRQKAYDALDKQVKDLEGQQTDVAGKLEQAQKDTEAAQKLSDTCGKAVVVAAQVELDALAALRDAPPLVFTAPFTNANADMNPCRRIYMYAYCDRNTLFLYGPRDCVDQARERIAQLDRPGAQAKLTLWTLELTSGGRAALKLNNAIATVDRELAYTRSCNAAAVAVLRQCIQEEVAKAASAAPAYQGETNADRLKRYHFYSPPVCRAMGFVPLTKNDRNPLTGSVTENAQEEMQRGLEDAGSAWLTQWTLPDPMAITTLGEALMVLSLAKNSYRAAVITDFKTRLAGSVVEIAKVENLAAKHLPPAPCGARQVQFPERGVSCDFVRLNACLVGDRADELAQAVGKARSQTTQAKMSEELQRTLDKEELTPAQLEIVRALQRVALGNIEGYVRTSLPRLQDASEQDSLTIRSKLNAMLMWMYDQFGILLPPLPTSDDTRAFENQLEEVREQLRRQTEHRFPATVLNARVAAANQMLKEMVCAFEDDVDCHFTRPMLDRLRLNLQRRGIRVGIIQRTSVLGMNRQYSHVGATSSAQLALGETIDILGEVQEAIKIYAAVQTASVWQALAGLKNLPTDRPPELYGITTRGAFEVTPIVDPSGQALRFRLRHVQANEVREPNGTVNPKMPRIERHTVDTEVQLTSTEIREISRYSANEALGLPTVKTGGLPILKHIPFLKELPLIGWFTLRTGKAASIQESLILGQTTVYPTIQEMMDLLLMGCPTEPN